MGILKVKGWHGTTLKNGNAILKNGFSIEKVKKTRFGNGIYFYLEEIGKIPPKELAENWVIYEVLGQRKNDRYMILSAISQCDSSQVIDLREREDAKAFQHIQQKIRDDIKKKQFEITGQGSRSVEFYVLEWLKKVLGLKAAIVVQCTQLGDIKNLGLYIHIPNSVILIVYDCSIIDQATIKEESRGKIK